MTTCPIHSKIKLYKCMDGSEKCYKCIKCNPNCVYGKIYGFSRGWD